MSDKYISIGKITNFHGIAGEVKAGYTKGKEHQLLGENIFFVKVAGEYKKLTLDKIRFHKNSALIKFREINSINDALEYKGCILYLEIESLRNTLETDEFLVDDLTGIEVFNQNGEKLGVVDCINKQGFSDLLSIKNNEGKTYLVPFVKELVPEVDLKNKKIVINAIEGLID